MHRRIPEYFKEAKQHEDVFKGMLKDMKQTDGFIPEELDTDAPLETILEKYSEKRYNFSEYCFFQILDFKYGPEHPEFKLEKDEALMTFYFGHSLNTRGLVAKYKVKENNIEHIDNIFSWEELPRH